MKALRRSGLLVLIFFFLFANVSLGARGAAEHYNKGVKYASGGNFIKARNEFEAALKINPNHSRSKYNLEIIEDTIDLKVKKEATIHIFKGVTFYDKRRWSKAIKEYTKAIKIEPGFAAAYVNRGSTYDRKGQYDLSISDYTNAIEIYPGFAGAYHNRAGAYYKKGQHDLAISDYTKDIEIRPMHASTYFNRGNAYSKKRHFDRAISDYTKTLEIEPRHALAYHNRGIAYLEYSGADDMEKVCADWKRACEFGKCEAYNYVKSEGRCT